jgi:hypothetical protein
LLQWVLEAEQRQVDGKARRTIWQGGSSEKAALEKRSRDYNGQALAYVYFEEEPGRRAAAKLLTCDEARRIATSGPKRSRPEKVRPAR